MCVSVGRSASCVCVSVGVALSPSRGALVVLLKPVSVILLVNHNHKTVL